MKPVMLLACSLLTLVASCSKEDDDPSAPPVNLAPTLAIGSGTAGQPPQAAVGVSAANVAVLRAELTAGPGEDVAVSAFVIRASGTLDDALDVVACRLHVDDGDGAFSPALDLAIQTRTFSADDGVLSFAPMRTIPAGAVETWWLAVDFAGTAAVGETIIASMPDATYVAAAGAVTAAAVVPTGLPLLGNAFTIGNEWVQLATAGTSPPDLYGYSMVYDTANNRLVLFGGKDGSGSTYNTVWSLNLAVSPPAWSQLLTGGPVARYGHVAGYKASPLPRMAMFGGWDPSIAVALSDTWELSLSSGTEAWNGPLVTAAMSPMVWACAAWPAASSDMIMFGGCDKDLLSAGGPVVYYGGIFLFRFGAPGGVWTYWGNGTYGAGGACMADDPARGRVVVFGGWQNPGGVARVVDSGFSFVWSGVTIASLTPSPRPSARWLASFATRPSDQKAYLFGGRDLTAPMQDLQAYDLVAGTWSTPSPITGGPPAARFGHASVVLGSNPDRVYLFTGSPAGGSVWTFR